MDILDFPPFYTIQPVQQTRDKQLELWKQVILKSCSQGGTTMLVELATFAAFANPKIRRELDMEGRQTVGDYIVQLGFAEWEDPTTKTRLRIFSKTPEAFASIVYDWAKQTGRVGDAICTFYEIHSGDDTAETELAGIHEDVLMKALKILEKQGKAQHFPGSTMDETGIKFL